MTKKTGITYKFQIFHKENNKIVEEVSNQYNKYLYKITESRATRNTLRREMRNTGSIVYNGYIITRFIDKAIEYIHNGFPPGISKKNRNATWLITNNKTGVTLEVSNLSEFLRRIGWIYETKKELSALYSELRINGTIIISHFNVERIDKTANKELDPYAALLSDKKKKTKK